MKKKPARKKPQPERHVSAEPTVAVSAPGEKFCWAAMAVLLCVACGRMFLGELPFRMQPIDKSVLMGIFDAEKSMPPVSMLELARVWFPVAIFLAGGLWLTGEVLRKKLKISGIVGGIVAVLFIVLSVASCFYAADRRSAEMVWLEQLAMIFGGFVMMQLCRCRRRLAVVLVVLAALGATMGIKGLYEKTSEIPDRISYFQMYRDTSLKEQGMSPDSSSAKAFEARLMNTTPGGYMALSNVFGSSLLLLLPAGLAVSAGLIRNARQQKKSGRFERGEIPPAAVAGGLCLILSVITALVLVWTRSRGAIGAAAVVLILLMALWRFRGALRRRFATSVIVGVLAVAALIGAVTAYGVKHDTLGMKTMTFRWFYWTGGAKLIKEHWEAGVGGGNFGDAYLQVRRPEAEEEVKTPHNYIIHSLCQFGVFAGGAYIVLVGLAVAGGWRSVARADGELVFDVKYKWLGWLIAALMATAVLARGYFMGMGPLLLILDAIMPAMVLGAMVWLFAWQFNRLPMWVCSLALAVGVSAFVLHNMVTYSLWTPGVATLFWLIAGAACAAGCRAIEWRRGTAIASLCVWAILGVLVIIWIVRPVTRRMFYTQELGYEFRSKAGMELAEKAANADPLDYIAARNVASQSMLDMLRKGTPNEVDMQKSVLFWLRESRRRNMLNPQNTLYISLAESYEIVPGVRSDEFLGEVDNAAALNPSDAEFMLRLAAICNFVEQNEKRNELISRAHEINERLKKFDPNSGAVIPEERFKEAARPIDRSKLAVPFVFE